MLSDDISIHLNYNSPTQKNGYCIKLNTCQYSETKMLKSYIAQELKKAEAKVGRNRAIYWIKG